MAHAAHQDPGARGDETMTRGLAHALRTPTAVLAHLAEAGNFDEETRETLWQVVERLRTICKTCDERLPQR